MQNILINMCEKCHYDRLRNDRALGNRKSDNNKNPYNKNKNNVGSAWWGPVSGSNKNLVAYFLHYAVFNQKAAQESGVARGVVAKMLHEDETAGGSCMLFLTVCCCCCEPVTLRRAHRAADDKAERRSLLGRPMSPSKVNTPCSAAANVPNGARIFFAKWERKSV